MSTKLIVNITGDSISGPVGTWPWIAFGATSAGDASHVNTMYPFVYYSGRMMLHNMAIAGSRFNINTDNVLSVRPGYVDPTYARKSFSRSGASPRKYLYICAIGTNDGAKDAFSTVDQYAAAVAQDMVTAKVNGADYAWLVTLLPRADAGAALTEPNRSAYNTLIRDPSWRLANGIDDFIDLASAAHADPSFLPANSGGDTTWFNADNIHPQSALSTEMSVIGLAKLNALLAIV